MEQISNLGKYTYFWEQENIEFDMYIPKYWSEIYAGKPREELYYDYRAMLSYLKKISKDKYCLDLGGNHGLFAVPACKLGYKVISFEPVQANFESLSTNLTSNNCQDFTTVKKAVSDFNGEIDIFVPTCPDNSSFSKEAAIANMLDKNSVIAEKVKVVKLDDWIKEYPEYSNIGLIKADLQGGEFQALYGFSEFLSQVNNIYLIVEFEEHLNKMGYSYDELQSLIIGFGFKQVGIIGNDRVYFKQ